MLTMNKWKVPGAEASEQSAIDRGGQLFAPGKALAR